MELSWLHLCAEGETAPCLQPTELAYLAALAVGLAVIVVVAVRSRDLTTATLTLMPIAIAINIAVASIVVALRLPIYLDSIGTVLVAALAGPWAAAITGLLTDPIWAILPVPGGGGPTTAFFAPVAAVIGLLAGFWAGRGVFRVRADDPAVGRFLAPWAGIAATVVAFVLVQQTIGMPSLSEADAGQLADNQLRFVAITAGLVALGLVVGAVTARTVFAFRGGTAHLGRWLVIASATTAGTITLLVLWLLFAPAGWFSTVDGTDPAFLWGLDLSGLALSEDVARFAVAAAAVAVALMVGWWARRGENAHLFPVLVAGITTGIVAASIAAPIAAGPFGGVTGGGTDAVVALFRSMGLSVLQSTFAQGLTSDPLDKALSFAVVATVLVALPITVRTMFSRGETVVAD
jgi:energy-coupling factor transport system substrate-specific component